MSFEGLAFRHRFTIPDFPARWLPLTHLYDPDLPLFPICYFHVVIPDPQGRPLESERAYGYVEAINVSDAGGIDAVLVCNKDLDQNANARFRVLVEAEVRERLGLADRVTRADVVGAFSGQRAQSNSVLGEMWDRVVGNAYGNCLPFGRLWDGVLGLARFVGSWNSPSGRKSELIQTHYFASRFGERIQSAGSIPQVDFFLLPTIAELTDHANPLMSFPAFAQLLSVAIQIQRNHCTLNPVQGLKISAFRNPGPGRFDTGKLMDLLRALPANMYPAAIECFNAFDKGPQRTIMFLLLLADVREGRIAPGRLAASQFGALYDGLTATYQSPKVIAIYAQQCFGNHEAMPVDTWIETFLRYPLNVWPAGRVKGAFSTVFNQATGLGKVERLLWVTGQARKVHSSACNDAFWCLKYGSDERTPRGANPLACNICLHAVRAVCPAYHSICSSSVAFNRRTAGADFYVETSAHNNQTPAQRFIRCEGIGAYGRVADEFSPADSPNGFAAYPQPPHAGGAMTVDEFVARY